MKPKPLLFFLQATMPNIPLKDRRMFDAEEITKAVKAWLKQYYLEINDNDEWRAVELIKQLIKEATEKPFRAYLRCVEPSEACFNCQFIVQCRALNGEQKT